jgi:hypothetical protein
LLYTQIFDNTGLTVGWKSLKNYSFFILSDPPGKQENPSVATLDTLARYVLHAPYTTETERKKKEGHYPYWYRYREQYHRAGAGKETGEVGARAERNGSEMPENAGREEQIEIMGQGVGKGKSDEFVDERTFGTAGLAATPENGRAVKNRRKMLWAGTVFVTLALVISGLTFFFRRAPELATGRHSFAERYRLHR